MRAPTRLPLLPGPATVTPPTALGSGPTGPRYRIETWGCQMNVYDSERFSGQLTALGFTPAADAEAADLILLNTCSVREKAAEKLFSRLGRLRRLKQANPGLVVGVAGCVAQQERERILKRSGVVDFVIGTKAVGALPDLLAEVREGRRPIDVSIRDDRYDAVRPIAREAAHRAYVTVVEGCNKSCSFCIVPFTRGAEVNRNPASILAEVEAAVATGAIEVELLGQNVNAYRHGEVDFAALLRMVDRVTGLRRLRFTTSHPRELGDRVIAAMAESATVCEHLHLPVQSGSDSVLRRMYRGYDRNRYLGRVRKLREGIPDVAVSTDIIVGFPGETEEELGDTLRLLDEVQFDQVFAFVYSPRPGTRALELDDPVTREEKEGRLQRLFARQEGISRRKNLSFVGKDVEVLVEGSSKRDEGDWTGRTRDNRIVNFAGRTVMPGSLCRVRVTKSHGHSLRGEAV